MTINRDLDPKAQLRDLVLFGAGRKVLADLDKARCRDCPGRDLALSGGGRKLLTKISSDPKFEFPAAFVTWYTESDEADGMKWSAELAHECDYDPEATLHAFYDYWLVKTIPF